MLEGLQPQNVFTYFEELTHIPHGSGNTKAISDYCVSFAKEHNLKYYQDEVNNVIIVKEASAGREQDAGVILQGHLDMVAVKDADSDHDFMKDPLPLAIHNDWITSTKTSLGGDDGIAVAYALAILADDNISHPHLEVILTVDEETGMEGASAIDLSMITGKYLLNLDSEEEGIILTSCAGGLRGDMKLPVQYVQADGIAYTVTVKGLNGGHSGAEIHKERGNAIKLAGRMLYLLNDSFEIGVCGIKGGEKDNAIPRECSVELMVSEAEAQEMEQLLIDMEETFRKEFAVSDSGLQIEITKKGTCTQKVLTPMAQEKMIFLLMNVPNGVQHMSMDIEGLVETSLNCGVVSMNDEVFELTASLRSSVKSRKYALSMQLKYLTEFLGGDYSIYGDYPEWEYKRDSKLREAAVAVYEEMFGKKPEIQAIHAGLECGLLLEKCPDLDVISFGPDMKDIHTPKEALSISSTKKMWDYLIAILEKIS
ncbi:MAG: aminoacyl-histidine dipeptidase [Lachnospiraceae bacterium]|nr:aminoacyl-histidine dipeptidase [Lachnospiraceae bacterium]